MAPRIETDAAVIALLGFAVWETRKAYTDSAPSLTELRSAAPGTDSHITAAQHLLDADMTVGLVAILAGFAASYFTQSWMPIALVGGTYLALCYYHHAVLSAPSPEGK